MFSKADELKIKQLKQAALEKKNQMRGKSLPNLL
jgi:hypothetical protein